MLKHILYCYLLLTSATSLALDTAPLTQPQLLRLGNALAYTAGASQWQQLWQRVRETGHLRIEPEQRHFTLPQTRLPELARQTLETADQVLPVNRTQALYRRDFSPTTIGQVKGQPLNAFCLVVDWRSLPEAMRENPHAYLGQASLLEAYPCE
ncbi:hypothetical protein P0Y43_14875 [Pseudomonas entomophila]|uniref:hypothetical protein n=1 Tax=Pseudomonas entomophila TaxID=312306 RepID=UPI0023D7CC70|nr:hypothetical protein [Pseudomonas entomophila]MDF0731996.1 hypothetical protein [Pseudomonas entomophila]